MPAPRACIQAAVSAIALLLVPASFAQKWQTSYSYDEGNSTLKLADLQFASALRGVAVGVIEQKRSSKPVTVSTSDGGRRWTLAPLPKPAKSLFFLDGDNGWFVAESEGGIWQTADGGRTWHALHAAPKSVDRVYFLDQNRGFAIGRAKSAYRTVDGGQTWKPIPEAAAPDTKTENTTYNCITFVTSRSGLLSGYSMPPESNDEGREVPHLSIMLDTRDGGETWNPSTASIFGHIAKAMFLRDGRGLGLIEFTDRFRWPSEVHRLDGGSGKSGTVFAQKDRAITDLLLTPAGVAYIAGIEVEPDLQHPSTPHPLKILESDDLASWDEMEVGSGARAIRPILRQSRDGTVWAATDTGLILKLSPAPE